MSYRKYFEESMKILAVVFVLLLTTRIQKIEKNPVSWRFNLIFRNCSRLFFVWYLFYFFVMKIAWKSSHPFCRNVANRRTAAHSLRGLKQSRQSRKILPNCFVLSCGTYIGNVTIFCSTFLIMGLMQYTRMVPRVISDMSWTYHENPFTRFS